MVRAIERKEMDRLLDLKPLPAAEDSEGRRALLKQISDDFREIQNLNNTMMAQAWAKEDLDYRYIYDMVSQIRKKASRLKTNLSLPEPEGSNEKQPAIEIATAQDLRKGLLYLDRLIMSFVMNPLFKQVKVVEVASSIRASRDLVALIEHSDRLKRSAARLSKSQKPK
jgi:hypothetical protein